MQSLIESESGVGKIGYRALREKWRRRRFQQGVMVTYAVSDDVAVSSRLLNSFAEVIRATSTGDFLVS